MRLWSDPSPNFLYSGGQARNPVLMENCISFFLIFSQGPGSVPDGHGQFAVDLGKHIGTFQSNSRHEFSCSTRYQPCPINVCTFRGQHAQAGGTTGGTAAGTLKVAVPGTGEPCPLLLSTRLSSRCFALIADSHVTRQWYRYRACPVSDIGKLLSPTVQVRRARCFRTYQYPKLNLNPSAFLMLRMLAATTLLYHCITENYLLVEFVRFQF